MSNFKFRIMKAKNIFIGVVLLAAIIGSCKKKETTTDQPGTASDAVKTYFGFIRASDGLNSSIKTPVPVTEGIASSRLKSTSETPGEWPDFYTNPFSHIFSDSCGIQNNTGTVEPNGDKIITYHYGAGTTCTMADYVKSGTASFVYYYPESLQAPIIDSYSIITDCKFEYISTGKCFSLIGSTTVSSTGQLWMRQDQIKMGECGNEFSYSDNQEYYYKDKSLTNSLTVTSLTIVDNGTRQYKGSKATYNVTVVEPVEKLNTTDGYIVKGVEKVTYTKDGVNGEFTIDYGDETDDSKATITENGQSYEVDYVTLQNEMYGSLN